MLEFDQSIGWQALEERQARTDKPRQRQLLQAVIDHVEAEVGLSIDGLIDTLVAFPDAELRTCYLDYLQRFGKLDVALAG